MSLTALVVYCQRHDLKLGIATNARGCEETTHGRMTTIWAGRHVRTIDEPGDFEDLESAAGRLLDDLVGEEERAA